MLDAHPVVPALLELTGYPLHIYSFDGKTGVGWASSRWFGIPD
jgi:hypothetical protein